MTETHPLAFHCRCPNTERSNRAPFDNNRPGCCGKCIYHQQNDSVNNARPLGGSVVDFPKRRYYLDGSGYADQHDQIFGEALQELEKQGPGYTDSAVGEEAGFSALE